MAAKGDDRTQRAAKGREKRSGQSQHFVTAARELGADQSEEAFDEALRRIGEAPAPIRPREGRKPR